MNEESITCRGYGLYRKVKAQWYHICEGIRENGEIIEVINQYKWQTPKCSLGLLAQCDPFHGCLHSDDNWSDQTARLQPDIFSHFENRNREAQAKLLALGR